MTVALTDTQYRCKTLAVCFSVLSRRIPEVCGRDESSLFVEPSATPQIRTEENAFDPWTDDEPSSAQVKKTMSDGSYSELSMEAMSDWEQLVDTSNDAESSYTPPRCDPPSDISFPVECRFETTSSSASASGRET